MLGQYEKPISTVSSAKVAITVDLVVERSCGPKILPRGTQALIG